MAFLRKKREVPVEIIFDSDAFHQVADRVRELLDEVHEAVTHLDMATKDLQRAREAVDASTAKLKAAGRRRPIITNSH